MTIPRLREMTQYWKFNPPVHLMIAAYFGLDDKPALQDEGSFSELLAGVPMM
jgi:hypothetical protein